MLKLGRVCWQRSQFMKSGHCHWTLNRCGALVGLFASTVYSTNIWTSQTERCIPLHAFGHFFFCCEVLKSSSSTFWILPLTPDHPPASSHSRSSVFVLLSRYCSLFLRSDKQERAVMCSNWSEVSLSRHTGHSYLTHSFILRKEEALVCVACNAVITVKHILIECADLLEIRKKYFEEKSLYSLFRNMIPEITFDFLRKIGVFYKIWSV